MRRTQQLRISRRLALSMVIAVAACGEDSDARTPPPMMDDDAVFESTGQHEEPTSGGETSTGEDPVATSGASTEEGCRGHEDCAGAELCVEGVCQDEAGVFVWPLSAWVAANHEYVTGTPHTGSADLAAHLGTPVQPVRPGVVIQTVYTQRDGWRVRLEHPSTDGTSYLSSYSHLLDAPPVSEGDHVGLDTVIGHLGRVGNADASGPHVHFFIARYDDDGTYERLVIPDLEIGAWVHSGAYIDGEYEGLDAIARPERTLAVEVAEPHGLRVYRTRERRQDEVIAELPAGTELEVVNSEQGQYQIEVDGELGWIPHSGTRVAGSSLFGVVNTASPSGVGNVRAAPGTDAALIGVVSGGTRLTAYETSGSWFRVLWRCTPDTNRSDDPLDPSQPIGGCPGLDSGARWKYGWVGSAVTEASQEFDARTRVHAVAVHRNRIIDAEAQPDPDDVIGSLEIRARLHVTGTRDGWYRIVYDGGTGWVRGWYTAGRQ